VGLSGQMHGVVLCTSDGTPVRPAIVWADTRSVEQAQRIRAELGAQQLARLGSAPFPGFAGVTLAWLADHEPQSLAQARWALQPKDWLRQQLTGHIATEPSDASGTLLYDLIEGGWSAPALEICGVRPELLAPISASADNSGPVTLTGSALTGIPVALGGADAARQLAAHDRIAGRSAFRASLDVGTVEMATHRDRQVLRGAVVERAISIMRGLTAGELGLGAAAADSTAVIKSLQRLALEPVSDGTAGQRVRLGDRAPEDGTAGQSASAA